MSPIFSRRTAPLRKTKLPLPPQVIALPNIINREFDSSLRCLRRRIDLHCWLWYFCVLYSRRAKDIAKISIVPGIFNNESRLYGLPIVLNPIMVNSLIYAGCQRFNCVVRNEAHGLVPLVQRWLCCLEVPLHWSRFLLCRWQAIYFSFRIDFVWYGNLPAVY